MSRQPTTSNLTVLHQICNHIPPYLVSQLARQHGVNKQARTFCPWSHLFALMFAHLSRAFSLNDVCDALRLHRGKCSRIRRARPPAKNTFSHANRRRDPAMAQALFWCLLERFQKLTPGFRKSTFKAMPPRFNRAIYAADSTTIALALNCIDWAKHRRRKAAAKLHLRLDLRSFLPAFAVVDTAGQSDSRRAWELCAGLQAGEIAVFDKAYMDFPHLADLTRRGVFWVTRNKADLKFQVDLPQVRRPGGPILHDDWIVLTGEHTSDSYPMRLRRVSAMVEIDGQQRRMDFITNNLDWAASSICDLYKSRWAIEVFFKQLKQTLKLRDFLGYNKNAVLWQVWTALIVYLILRYLAYLHRWPHGFKRLVGLLRATMWDGIALSSLTQCCGTARAGPSEQGSSIQLYLLGFEPLTS